MIDFVECVYDFLGGCDIEEGVNGLENEVFVIGKSLSVNIEKYS